MMRRNRLPAGLRAWTFIATLAALASSAHWTAAQSVAVDDSSPGQTARHVPDRTWPPQLTRATLYAVGLEGLGGLSIPAESDVQSAHVFGGGLLRLRLRNIEAGAMYLMTDSTRGVGGFVPRGDNQWRSVGGFAGAWLPFHHWLDVEAAGGVGRRTYGLIGPRFGGGERSVTVTEVFLRAGMSARTSEALLGARVGAAIIANLDLDRPSLPWRYAFGPPGARQVRTGRTPVGGFSVGMLLSVGLELGGPAPGSD